jgi:hypothetical protein
LQVNKQLKKMKKYLILLIVIFSAAIFLMSGCRKYPRIVGNNQVTTETRQLVSFDRVENDGTFHVYIEQDSVFSATVQAESNLIPHIRTRVNGSTLIIDTRENLNNNAPMNIYVTTPIIQGAYLSGSGSLTLDSLYTQHMDVVISGSGSASGYITGTSLVTRISGSGTINLEAYTSTCSTSISGSGDTDLLGETLNGNFSISGSGSIRSYNFTQKECIAKISGSGSMYLNVSDKLDVTISGSGSVYYIGEPALNVKITGSGQVIKQQ